jgi:hypothetical protein
MANAHITQQSQHMPRVEHVTHQTIIFAQIQTLAVAGDNPCRILAAVLKYCQPVVQGLIDAIARYDADDSTHGDFYLN